MAGAILTSFPAGTEVKCYLEAQCVPWKEQRTLPPGTAAATETVASDSTLTITGVDAGPYYAVGTINGTVRFHNFHAVA